MEELYRLISLSYGRADFIFAGHPTEADFARQALVEAGNKTVGLAQFLGMHRQYLTRAGCSEEHIKEQLERVQDLECYFDYD